MHSLCAACSWRQSFCSGTAPWYYIRFPREHTLIVGLLSITEPEISSFSWGDSVSKARHLILFYSSTVNRKSAQFRRWLLLAPLLLPNTMLNTRCEGKSTDGKMKASLFLLQFCPSTVSPLCEESWLWRCALNDKLENNTINSRRDLKLAI